MSVWNWSVGIWPDLFLSLPLTCICLFQLLFLRHLWSKATNSQMRMVLSIWAYAFLLIINYKHSQGTVLLMIICHYLTVQHLFPLDSTLLHSLHTVCVGGMAQEIRKDFLQELWVVDSYDPQWIQWNGQNRSPTPDEACDARVAQKQMEAGHRGLWTIAWVLGHKPLAGDWHYRPAEILLDFLWNCLFLSMPRWEVALLLISSLFIKGAPKEPKNAIRSQ